MTEKTVKQEVPEEVLEIKLQRDLPAVDASLSRGDILADVTLLNGASLDHLALAIHISNVEELSKSGTIELFLRRPMPTVDPPQIVGTSIAFVKLRSSPSLKHLSACIIRGYCDEPEDTPKVTPNFNRRQRPRLGGFSLG